MEKGNVSRTLSIALGILVLAVGVLFLVGYTINLHDSAGRCRDRCSYLEAELKNNTGLWHSKHDLLKAELEAPQACVRISKMSFEWRDRIRVIKGEVKNFGKVDAQHVSVHVHYYYEGDYPYVAYGDMDWVDYLRAGENKPFEVEVSDYERKERIYFIELSYKTVGEYGREWDSGPPFRGG